MAVFVINEWLWADASGNNGPHAQRQALDVVTKLAESDHQIVVMVGSQFDQKAWTCCKSTNPAVRGIAVTYVTTVRQNSDRCVLLKPVEVVALADDLASSIKSDDHYLIQAQLSIRGAVLVTTDTPLREVVLKAGLQCLSREEFLSTYF